MCLSMSLVTGRLESYSIWCSICRPVCRSKCRYDRRKSVVRDCRDRRRRKSHSAQFGAPLVECAAMRLCQIWLYLIIFVSNDSNDSEWSKQPFVQRLFTEKFSLKSFQLSHRLPPTMLNERLLQCWLALCLLYVHSLPVCCSSAHRCTFCTTESVGFKRRSSRHLSNSALRCWNRTHIFQQIVWMIEFKILKNLFTEDSSVEIEK